MSFFMRMCVSQSSSNAATAASFNLENERLAAQMLTIKYMNTLGNISGCLKLFFCTMQREVIIFIKNYMVVEMLVFVH